MRLAVYLIVNIVKHFFFLPPRVVKDMETRGESWLDGVGEYDPEKPVDNRKYIDSKILPSEKQKQAYYSQQKKEFSKTQAECDELWRGVIEKCETTRKVNPAYNPKNSESVFMYKMNTFWGMVIVLFAYFPIHWVIGKILGSSIQHQQAMNHSNGIGI